MKKSSVNAIRLISVVLIVVFEQLMPSSALAQYNPWEINLSENSIFGEINSYVEGIDYDSVFSEKNLTKSEMSRFGKGKSVFEDVALYKTMIFEKPLEFTIGGRDLATDSLTTLVVIQCCAAEKSINDAILNGDLWDCCLPINNKHYLIRRFCEQFFESVDNRIEIHSMMEEDKKRSKRGFYDKATWYFFIKENEIASIYIKFVFGGESDNPVYDLLNAKFIR